jgi:phosphonate transport system ATP-binding protein
VITSLHVLEMARQYAGRVVALSAGRVVYDGATAALTPDAAAAVFAGGLAPA